MGGLRNSMPILDTLKPRVRDSPKRKSKGDREERKSREDGSKQLPLSPLTSAKVTDRMRNLIKRKKKCSSGDISRRIRYLGKLKEISKKLSEKNTSEYSTDDLSNLVADTLAKLSKTTNENQTFKEELWKDYKEV